MTLFQVMKVFDIKINFYFHLGNDILDGGGGSDYLEQQQNFPIIINISNYSVTYEGSNEIDAIYNFENF